MASEFFSQIFVVSPTAGAAMGSELKVEHLGPAIRL